MLFKHTHEYRDERRDTKGEEDVHKVDVQIAYADLRLYSCDVSRLGWETHDPWSGIFEVDLGVAGMTGVEDSQSELRWSGEQHSHDGQSDAVPASKLDEVFDSSDCNL